MRARDAMPAVKLFAALGLGLGLPASAAADAYTLDPDHCFVVFRIKHLGVSYTYGRFNGISGTVALDDQNPEKSSLAVEIKADSVDTHNEKRDKHLKSPDFFNVSEFPIIAFKSTSVKKSGDEYEVTGDLTLHGVTKSVTIPFERTGSGQGMKGEERAGGEAELTVKRSDYGMTYMLDKVGDEVLLKVSLEGIRQ